MPDTVLNTLEEVGELCWLAYFYSGLAKWLLGAKRELRDMDFKRFWGWFGQKIPRCWGDLAKRLLGARAESVFWPDHPLARSLLTKSYLYDKIRYLYYDLAKRLLGVEVIWPKDSLVPRLSQHQGVFWPDHPNTMESFGQITPQNFKGHFAELFSTKESFSQTTVDLVFSALQKMDF